MSPDLQALRDQIGDASVIIWDLDNTLYHQADYDRGAFLDIAQALWPADPHKVAAAILRRKTEMGPHYRALFNDALAMVPQPRLTVAQCVDLYHRHDARLMMPENSLAPLLHHLAPRGVKMAVVSNGRTATQHRKIERLGLMPVLTEIVVADPADQRFALKPDPAAWHYLVQLHGFKDAIMVGDSDDLDGGFARNAQIGYIPFRFTADGFRP